MFDWGAQRGQKLEQYQKEDQVFVVESTRPVPCPECDLEWRSEENLLVMVIATPSLLCHLMGPWTRKNEP